MKLKQCIVGILAAFLMLSGLAAAAQPKIKGPLYVADRIMSTNRISQGGRIEALRNAAGDLSPKASITSFAVPEGVSPRPVSKDYAFLSAMLAGERGVEILPLLFADGLYPQSDTLSFLRGCAALAARQFGQAEAEMAAVPVSSAFRPQASLILSQVLGGPQDRRKSPVAAALMSAVIPGSGKIYAGNLREGVSALITVGALAGMTAECISKKGAGDWRSISLAAISGLFYAANIYGSYLSVSTTETIIDNARKTTVLFSIGVPISQSVER